MNHQKDNHFTEVQKRELDLSISNGNHTLVLSCINVLSGLAASSFQSDREVVLLLIISLLSLGGLIHRVSQVGTGHITRDLNNAIHHLLGNN